MMTDIPPDTDNETPDRWIAPWTPEQIDALIWWQQAGITHPYTCPNRGDGNHTAHLSWGLGALIPAPEIGWFCVDCDYTQDWALAISDDTVDSTKRMRDLIDSIGDARIKFWSCPNDHPREPLRVTVEWDGDTATCTDCGMTNKNDPRLNGEKDDTDT